VTASRGSCEKEGIKRNPEMQVLEDVICLVFLRWYFLDFTVKRADEDIERIVAKAARKMSTEARAAALAEFVLPPALAASFTEEAAS
jgi:Domain of unknown function (DUF4202)